MNKLGLSIVVASSVFAVIAGCSSSNDADLPLSDGGTADDSAADGSAADGKSTDANTINDASADANAIKDANTDDDADAGCPTAHYRDGTTCKACSAACSAGSYETSACSATGDRGCSTCPTIAHCSTVTCTSGSDQTCTACTTGHYLSQGSCVACSGACPAGQQQSAACSATTDRACTDCTVIPNCVATTCTSTTDQVCSACAAGFYLSNNACVPCSGACGAGEYEASACSATADRACGTCGAVSECASTPSCTSATDSQCDSCSSGFYLLDGATDSCAACSGACGGSQYVSAACGGTSDRTCSDCTTIAHCSSVTCTSASNQRCGACDSGYVVVDGTADTCERPKTCADLKRVVPATPDGVYTIDPDGSGGLDSFEVYCDMTTDGGGWTLVAKIGNGRWPELTAQEYVNLVANPVSDIGGALLTDGAMPLTKELAFFRRDRTNAIYDATPYAGQSAVRVIFDSAESNAADGTYFQQHHASVAGWDFWAALRDARRWSSAPSSGEVVSSYGTDFVLGRNAASFDASTNTVTHGTSGDSSFGYWDYTTLSLVDGSSLEVSRHGGLLGDGYGGYGWLWLITLNPGDGRFKNESYETKSTIWVR